MNFTDLINNENFQITVILILFTICVILCGCFMFGYKCNIGINKSSTHDKKYDSESDSDSISASHSNLIPFDTDKNFDEDFIPDNMPYLQDEYEDKDNYNNQNEKVKIKSIIHNNQDYDKMTSNKELNNFDYNNSLEGTPIGDYYSLEENNQNPIVTNDSPYLKNKLAVSSDVPVSGPMFNFNNTIVDDESLRKSGFEVSACDSGEQYYYLNYNLFK